MNRVSLIGRLTKDPEFSLLPGSGTAKAKIILAVDNPFQKDSDGKRTADFIPIIFWGKQAEAIANYTAKGSQIAVGGRIQVRKWEDSQGNIRYATDVIASEMQFLSKSNQQQNNNNSNNNYNSRTPFDEDMMPVSDEDGPF